MGYAQMICGRVFHPCNKKGRSRNLAEKRTSIFDNALIWFIGFLLYRKLMKIDLPIGSTVADILVTIVICVIVGTVKKSVSRK